MTSEVPMIYTARGNLPIASLRYETQWEITDAYIKLSERYVAEDGEVVRSSAHVYDKQGVSAKAAVASLG